jgi:hypothetical protein
LSHNQIASTALPVAQLDQPIVDHESARNLHAEREVAAKATAAKK